jgi:hypothetical protein
MREIENERKRQSNAKAALKLEENEKRNGNENGEENAKYQ